MLTTVFTTILRLSLIAGVIILAVLLRICFKKSAPMDHLRRLGSGRAAACDPFHARKFIFAAAGEGDA